MVVVVGLLGECLPVLIFHNVVEGVSAKVLAVATVRVAGASVLIVGMLSLRCVLGKDCSACHLRLPDPGLEGLGFLDQSRAEFALSIWLHAAFDGGYR